MTTVQKCFKKTGFLRNSGALGTAATSGDVDKEVKANVWSDRVKINCVDKNDLFTDFVDEEEDNMLCVE